MAVLIFIFCVRGWYFIKLISMGSFFGRGKSIDCVHLYENLGKR